MKSFNKSNTSLGIELGSTRIKAVLTDGEHNILAFGEHAWENKFVDNLWTYSLEDIHSGVRSCYASLKADVMKKYNTTLDEVGAIGISGMMHGYMVFDKNDTLLVPFRTWRNNNAEQASIELTKIFDYQIPARWSVAHLYAAIKNKEKHVRNISHITTLAGYIHYLLTGKRVVGVGEASGMLPIDLKTKKFDTNIITKFDNHIKDYNVGWKVAEILPEVLTAGQNAGTLTKRGASLLDPEGDLKEGIPFCPPEGDAGTGMVATCSIKEGTGNISAGTSIFGMIVLKKELSRVYPELDLVTTPDGSLVAMAHCNNCSSEINAWINVFDDVCKTMGIQKDKDELFTKLFLSALQGKADCGGLNVYNYLSGENITGIDEGRPMFVRSTESEFNLQNFMRAQIYSAFATLKIGLDILFEKENVKVEKIYGHGGIFKTAGVADRFLSAALAVPISVNKTASAGGPWGMAVLASFMQNRNNLSLPEYLDKRVFKNVESSAVMASKEEIQGFNKFMTGYKDGLAVVKEAVKCLKN